MTRDPKYLPALISAPRLHGFRRSSHCERQEASRFPNPAKKLVPQICSWQEGARNHAGLQQRKRRQGEKLWLDRPGGLASISGLRVTAPPHTLHSRSRRARRPGSPRGPRTQGWPPPGGRRQVNGGPPPGGGAWRRGPEDREFLRTLPGLLIVAEIVLGLLVWTLIAGTEYFRVPAFGWVMFVAVFYWVLTVFFLIIYITMTYTRIPQVPWTTVGLCFNGSAFVLYLSAAIVDASSVSPERDSHNFNSWAASSFFAFLVTICYAGNTYFSFIAWRSRTIQ
ncbi:CKLF-like MARVEL transmembrane domain-containing protein 8 [Neophocaena asiaeorientalis asiaeorientalis]|uniref:CKLF-like MARVEL transmembrane domain-containing protein 8 n=1 Tax=Neophocaena asiaeorientalis asiaeorientalis TaxID=1706337 RepID=A0A341B8M6_NEOAA|nr:CKLF-like MARVEL transmembrane domain-containing protein 8 [Neophocaena asiaeorientalis asiaeorientalis]